MATELCVLGATRIRVGDTVVGIRGKLKRRLVARLALARGARVDADTLIEAMWNDAAPRTARQSLHVHISHLREALAEASVSGLITTVDGGYTLGLPLASVDVTVFERRVEAGTIAAQHGELRAARAHLTDGLDLWDAPFDDLADNPAAVSERYRLHALHEHALDELHEVLIGLDDEQAIPRLRAVVGERPLRERPYEQLIRALTAHGDPAAATTVHLRATETFRDELGISPSRRLQEALNPATTRFSPAGPATRLGDALHHAGGCILYEAPATADLSADIAALAQRAGQAGRGFDRARVSPNDEAPLAPLLPLASITSIDAIGFGGRAREVMFEEIA
ncbi:MAG: BTAD domain-containing putative transcriptional regulator, partial [Actinomycetota bacterium]